MHENCIIYIIVTEVGYCFFLVDRTETGVHIFHSAPAPLAPGGGAKIWVIDCLGKKMAY